MVLTYIVRLFSGSHNKLFSKIHREYRKEGGKTSKALLHTYVLANYPFTVVVCAGLV